MMERSIERGRTILAVAFASMAVVTAGGCATNPATGESQLALISEEQEIEMGRQASQQVEATLGLVDDAALQQYVADVGERLAADSERPELPWHFAIVDDPAVNAFALPGGFIYVTRGIMGTFMSEAELAAVLGHEIGHVTARHTVEQLSQQQLYGGLATLGAAVFDLGSVAQGLLGTGLQLLFLKYSRDDERQADELGLRYMTRENYAPGEMLDVFRTLERVGEAQGGSGTPGWLSTHPSPSDRFDRIASLIQADTTYRANPIVARDAYLQHVDGLIYGVNPRTGFFRGTTFLHPDLRFRMEFPASWPAQNMALAVLARSPEQDAVIELTQASGGSADAALREFGSQQGVQLGAASGRSVNGFTAEMAEFEATTQQGPLGGMAAFIEYGGAVYRILGYSPATRYPTYRSTFEQTIGTFSRLTDPAILSVEPRRIGLVRIGSPLSLAEFANRYGGSVDAQMLSILNGVPTNGQLDAGLWKNVLGKAFSAN